MKKIPFFNVVAEKQTYLNLVYILFAFPLSTIYFSLIVTGVSLSLGLLIIIVGIFIFAATLLMVRGFRFIEIAMTEAFLSVRIEDRQAKGTTGKSGSFFNRVFGSGATWKSFIYFLFIKFSLDIVVFSISMTFIGITLHLLLAPIIVYYEWFESEPMEILLDFLEDPYVLPFLGIIWVFLTLHVTNGLSWIYRLANPVFLKE